MRRWPRRTAQEGLHELVGHEGHEFSHAVGSSRRYVATAPVVVTAVLALAALPGLAARDAVHASSAPVVIDSRGAGTWLPDLLRAAEAWNAVGLGRRVRVTAAATSGAVVVQLGRVAPSCGSGAAGCVVTRGTRRVLVLPSQLPAFARGTGPVTLVAHELGHLLGLGHRASGCTIMGAEPSARGCGQLQFTRTFPSPQCPWQTLRSWRCRTVEQRLELCGPTAEDAASVARRAGVSARAVRPRLCVAQELSGPSPRTARHARNAGLRVIVAREGPALLRAARRHDAATRRWCARGGTLPAVARRLCAIARA